MSFKRIAHGDLLFRGHNDKEVLENCIAKPIIDKIWKQLVNFCTELPEDQLYLIKWEIMKGEITK